MSDSLFMQRALELAQRGLGSVSPNPLVGCVIVHENRIIGEGWHQRYGQAHAEVHAIESVADQHLLNESTAYVSLEPCSHFGKTPPCADLLIAHKIKRVVVCNTDPNPLVAGKGLEKLRQAGIEVVQGILEHEGRWINRRFFTMMKKKRPYIILKWAQTADGFIARSNFDSKWISNAASRKLVHQWRTEEDAILVGSNTALRDNPQLNVRDAYGRNPLRIVIDRKLQLPENLKLFDQSQDTLCYTTEIPRASKENTTYIQLPEQDFINHLLADLFERKIQSVIVEGGLAVLQAFIDLNAWDEARIFTSEQTFGSGITAPQLRSKIISQLNILGDQLELHRPLDEMGANLSTK